MSQKTELPAGRDNATSRPRRNMSTWLRRIASWGLLVGVCYLGKYYQPIIDPQWIRMVIWSSIAIRMSLRKDSQPEEKGWLLFWNPMFDR